MLAATAPFDTTRMIFLVGLVALTAVALAYDMRWKRIPNWLTVSGLVLGLIFHTAISGWVGLGQALGGFGVGFATMLILWLTGGSGGGDVKLMAAIGAWLGPQWTLVVFVVSAVLVSLVGLALMARIALRKIRAGDLGQASLRRHGVPFAVPLGLSTWIVLAFQTFAPIAHVSS